MVWGTPVVVFRVLTVCLVVPQTTEVVSIKDPDETKDNLFNYLSSGDDTETEEAICNKDDKQSKTRKSKSNARKPTHPKVTNPVKTKKFAQRQGLQPRNRTAATYIRCWN